MIKIVNKKKPVKRHPEIGEAYLYTYGGIEHLVIRGDDRSFSLTDMNTYWTGSTHYGDPNNIELVDIEIKVL